MSLIGRLALSRAEHNEWPDRAQVNSGARFSPGSENHDNPLSWNRRSHTGPRINLALHGASCPRPWRCRHLCWPMPPDMAVGVPGSDALFYWLLRCGDPTRDEHHAPLSLLPRDSSSPCGLAGGAAAGWLRPRQACQPGADDRTDGPAGGRGAEFSRASQCSPISGCPGAGAGLLRPLGAQGKLAELAFCE